MTRILALGSLALVALAMGPARAAAQQRAGAQQDPPRLSIAAGGGLAMPLDADFDFTAAEWQLSVRGAISPHFALEGFFSDWRHDATRVLLDQPIQGPTGFLGRVGRIEDRTSHGMRAVGVNGLATGSIGRVTFAGGGGIGLLTFSRRLRQSATGCDASSAQLCSTFENDFTSSAATGQGVVDVDVAVTRRVHAFGRYQLVMAFEDPAFGHGSVAGGVRLVLW